VGLAALIMAGYLVATKRHLPSSWKDRFAILVVGFFNIAVPFTLITRAEESIDSSLATVLNSSVPLFSLVIAHFVLSDEKLNRYKTLGLLIGYAGIVILTFRGLSSSEGSPLQGQAFMIMAVASYAVAVVFMRARLRHIEPITTAGLTLIAAAAILIPITLLSESNLGDRLTHLSADTIGAILTLAVVNTVCAYFLFYHLIGEWGARATMVTYVFPPVGIALGAIFLKEVIDERLILGSGLILAGIVAVNYKPQTLRQPKPVRETLEDGSPA
ncbi:MAG: DMT family transporter, partial [Anaerolineae bacterium]|nr:DMT family transporter [Anaerolineae bacterium]